MNRDIATERLVRLIDANGENVGVVNFNEAFTRAQDAGMDLVEVSPNVRPVVCRIIDYGKFKYEQEKQAKNSRQRAPELKAIALGSRTDDADFARKASDADRFLNEGHTVDVKLRMRGRENEHWMLQLTRVKAFAAQIQNGTCTEPRHEGQFINMQITPKKA